MPSSATSFVNRIFLVSCAAWILSMVAWNLLPGPQEGGGFLPAAAGTTVLVVAILSGIVQAMFDPLVTTPTSSRA